MNHSSMQKIIAKVDGAQGMNSIVSDIKQNWDNVYAFDLININSSDYINFFKDLVLTVNIFGFAVRVQV